MPPPQAFSKWARGSNTVTLNPASASRSAHFAPPRPTPITATRRPRSGVTCSSREVPALIVSEAGLRWKRARCGSGGASAIVARVTYIVGKVLEVAAMLTLGAALIVYGFGEENMNAELGWLLFGTLVFLAGRALESRSRKGR